MAFTAAVEFAVVHVGAAPELALGHDAAARLLAPAASV
jgi:hypothetical protein